MHVVRDPNGIPQTYHRRLGHAFDYLAERNVETCVLRSEDWAVLVDLDINGERIPPPED